MCEEVKTRRYLSVYHATDRIYTALIYEGIIFSLIGVHFDQVVSLLRYIIIRTINRDFKNCLHFNIYTSALYYTVDMENEKMDHFGMISKKFSIFYILLTRKEAYIKLRKIALKVWNVYSYLLKLVYLTMYYGKCG